MVQTRVAVLVKGKIDNTLKNNNLNKIWALKTATLCHPELNHAQIAIMMYIHEHISKNDLRKDMLFQAIQRC